MPQDIGSLRFRWDPYDLHRDGLRFTPEQLSAWDEPDHRYWMVPHCPRDPSHPDCDHPVLDEEGVLVWPVVFFTPSDEQDVIEQAGIAYDCLGPGAFEFPSLIGWTCFPEREYFGMEVEEPDVVRLWDAWPLTAVQENKLGHAGMAEFEGGIYGTIRYWYDLINGEWSSLEELEEDATAPIPEDASPAARRSLLSVQRLAETTLEELEGIRSCLDFDEFGDPVLRTKQMQLELPPDLQRNWERLQGSHARAMTYLRTVWPDKLQREERLNPWY